MNTSKNHKHLCGQCGAELCECTWCDKEADNRISGRCEKCQKAAGEFWALQWATSYGHSISRAVFNGYAKEGLSQDYKPYAMGSVGEHTKLKHITWHDNPDRPSDGSFTGCNNQVWIISLDERDALIALDAERKQAKDAKEKAERIAYLQDRIKSIESPETLPTYDEAKRRMKNYNDMVNEGGSGYVPHIVSKEEYAGWKTELARLVA